MIPCYPCGTAVEMLRQTYEADYTFTKDGDPTVHLRWFFCAPGAAWLPYPTPYNSLQWVDARDRAKPADAPGEIAGTRTYSKSRRPIGEIGDSFCGTAANWAGDSGTPAIGTEVDADGVPACCGGTVAEGSDISLRPGFSGLVTNLASEGNPFLPGVWRNEYFPSTVLYAGFPAGWISQDWQVHLLNVDPMQTTYLWSDWECNFPGYAPVTLNFYELVADPVYANLERATAGPHHFEATGPGGTTRKGAIGYAVTDQFGFIFWYEVWPYARVFRNPGDYVDLSIPVRAAWDYM